MNVHAIDTRLIQFQLDFAFAQVHESRIRSERYQVLPTTGTSTFCRISGIEINFSNSRLKMKRVDCARNGRKRGDKRDLNHGATPCAIEISAVTAQKAADKTISTQKPVNENEICILIRKANQNCGV